MTEIKQIPDGYKEDAKGNLIPLANIREIDLMRDKEEYTNQTNSRFGRKTKSFNAY